MNQIFEEFRTILLHQSNCFILFCQHRVHGINKNEGLLSKTNQAQKLCSPFRWGILSLKVLSLAVVSTFRQFCSISCSAKLSTRPVKEGASRRSADQLNEPAKLSLLSLLRSKSETFGNSVTFAKQKWPLRGLPERSSGYGVPRVRVRRGLYPVTFVCSASCSALLSTSKRQFLRPGSFASLNPPPCFCYAEASGSEGSNCRDGVPVTRAHFCFAKLPERSSGNPRRGFRPSVTRGTLEFSLLRSKSAQEGGLTESYSAVCSARLAERKSLLCASTRSSANFEPKKLKREPKYSNRVGFTTFLGNTGIKWDAGTEEVALLNPPSGGSRNGVSAIASATQEQGRRSRHFGSKGSQGGGSESARLPCAHPTAEQEESKSFRNGVTPAVGYRVGTRVELLPNSFGTQHGQPPTKQLKLYSGVTPSLSTTKQGKQQGLTFEKLELLAVLGTARSSNSTFKAKFGVMKTSLNPRGTLSLFLSPLLLGPSSPCSCSCSSFRSTSKSCARLEENPKFTQPFTVWGVVLDTKSCETKLLDCTRSPFSTLLGQSRVGFGLSSPALCNNATNTKYKIIRPLLNLSRETLTILCKDLHLPVYPDKSNKAVQYSRNRLREQILPAIKLFLNPKIDHALFKLAELLTQDFSLVSHLVNTGRRSSSPLVRAHPSDEQGLPGT